MTVRTYGQLPYTVAVLAFTTASGLLPAGIAVYVQRGPNGIGLETRYPVGLEDLTSLWERGRSNSLLPAWENGPSLKVKDFRVFRGRKTSQIGRISAFPSRAALIGNSTETKPHGCPQILEHHHAWCL